MAALSIKHFQQSGMQYAITVTARVVKQEQQGRENYYSLEVEKIKEIDKWLNQFRKIWASRFNQFEKGLSIMSTDRKAIKKQKKC